MTHRCAGRRITMDGDVAKFVVSRNRRPEPARGFTLVEFLVVLAIIVLLIALLLPSVRTAGTAGRRTQCKNNLKQIGLALHNYHDTYGVLPPAYTVDVDGKPLHSWRTLILPNLEQKTLYDRIDLSKPWNDPANAEAFKTDIPAYRCPSADTPAGQTTYLAVVTDGSCLRPAKSMSFSEITDGLPNTLTVIEVDPAHAVPWMALVDADESFVLGLGPQTKLSHTGGMNALKMDGSVWFLSAELPGDKRLALISAAAEDNAVLTDD